MLVPLGTGQVDSTSGSVLTPLDTGQLDSTSGSVLTPLDTGQLDSTSGSVLALLGVWSTCSLQVISLGTWIVF